MRFHHQKPDHAGVHSSLKQWLEARAVVGALPSPLLCHALLSTFYNLALELSHGRHGEATGMAISTNGETCTQVAYGPRAGMWGQGLQATGNFRARVRTTSLSAQVTQAVALLGPKCWAEEETPWASKSSL